MFQIMAVAVMTLRLYKGINWSNIKPLLQLHFAASYSHRQLSSKNDLKSRNHLPVNIKRGSSILKNESNINRNTSNIIESFKKELNKFGIYQDDILRALSYCNDSDRDLEERIELIKNSAIEDGNLFMQLLQASLGDIKCYREVMKKCSSKISEYANLMECSKLDACKDFKKHKFLMFSKMSTIKSKIQFICEECNISKEHLRKDLLVLTFTKRKLEEREMMLRAIGMPPIKPWMLRCSEQIIERTWSNREQDKAAMAPYNSPEEFLCQKLGMNETQYQLFTSKHPPVMRVHVSKLKEIIDFLLSEGFTKTQIYHTPRVLCHSLKTVQIRLVAVREKRFEPHTLSILCLNKKNFSGFLKKLEHRSSVIT